MPPAVREEVNRFACFLQQPLRDFSCLAMPEKGLGPPGDAQRRECFALNCFKMLFSVTLFRVSALGSTLSGPRARKESKCLIGFIVGHILQAGCRLAWTRAPFDNPMTASAVMSERHSTGQLSCRTRSTRVRLNPEKAELCSNFDYKLALEFSPAIAASLLSAASKHMLFLRYLFLVVAIALDASASAQVVPLSARPTIAPATGNTLMGLSSGDYPYLNLFKDSQAPTTTSFLYPEIFDADDYPNNCTTSSCAGSRSGLPSTIGGAVQVPADACRYHFFYS